MLQRHRTTEYEHLDVTVAQGLELRTMLDAHHLLEKLRDLDAALELLTEARQAGDLTHRGYQGPHPRFSLPVERL